jgi:hypothetical protein
MYRTDRRDAVSDVTCTHAHDIFQNRNLFSYSKLLPHVNILSLLPSSERYYYHVLSYHRVTRSTSFDQTMSGRKSRCHMKHLFSGCTPRFLYQTTASVCRTFAKVVSAADFSQRLSICSCHSHFTPQFESSLSFTGLAAQLRTSRVKRSV